MTLGQRRPVLQAPAIQALFILCAALILALLVVLAVEQLFDAIIPPIPFAFLHGALAAGIACLRRMASWWAPILFFFPPAAVLVNSLHLPPLLFFAVFLFLLLLFWSTFRSQVPFYPSGQSTWDAVAALLPADKPLCVIDIGSGLGGAVLYLSKLRVDSRFVGIELAPLPWLVSRVRALLARSRGAFVRGDYTLLDFRDYDAIFAYLSPAAMAALWQKAREEMRPGTLLLSYEFIIEGVQPDVVVHPKENGPALYGWRM
jgi:SAM-dependent methyltransferase